MGGRPRVPSLHHPIAGCHPLAVTLRLVVLGRTPASTRMAACRGGMSPARVSARMRRRRTRPGGRIHVRGAAAGTTRASAAILTLHVVMRDVRVTATGSRTAVRRAGAGATMIHRSRTMPNRAGVVRHWAGASMRTTHRSAMRTTESVRGYHTMSRKLTRVSSRRYAGVTVVE
jgi:hypothetical protein